MKKFVTVILAFVYLVTTSGVVVTLHYCMGKLSSAGLGNAKIEKCGICGMKEDASKEGCCHTENNFLKVDDSHNYSKVSFEINSFIAVIPVQFTSLEQSAQGLEKTIALQYHSPPDKRYASVYLYNNVFRI
jgi:hypothetical protein